MGQQPRAAAANDAGEQVGLSQLVRRRDVARDERAIAITASRTSRDVDSCESPRLASFSDGKRGVSARLNDA